MASFGDTCTRCKCCGTCEYFACECFAPGMANKGWLEEGCVSPLADTHQSRTAHRPTWLAVSCSYLCAAAFAAPSQCFARRYGWAALRPRSPAPSGRRLLVSTQKMGYREWEGAAPIGSEVAPLAVNSDRLICQEGGRGVSSEEDKTQEEENGTDPTPDYFVPMPDRPLINCPPISTLLGFWSDV